MPGVISGLPSLCGRGWQHTTGEDAAPGGAELIHSLDYSANVYAARAISKIDALPPTHPLYIHLRNVWPKMRALVTDHVTAGAHGFVAR